MGGFGVGSGDVVLEIVKGFCFNSLRLLAGPAELTGIVEL